MSQENVELVQRMIEAYNRRDPDGLRAVFDTDAELDWSASKGVEAGVYRGIDAVMGWLTGYLDTFDKVVIGPERFIEWDDSVVVPNVTVFHGRDGVKATARSAFVYEVQGSRIKRFCLYQDTQQALEAVGLTE